jgi:hypothetical protein
MISFYESKMKLPSNNNESHLLHAQKYKRTYIVDTKINNTHTHTYTPIINLLFDLQDQQISISKFNLHSKKIQEHIFIQKNYPTNYKLSLS